MSNNRTYMKVTSGSECPRVYIMLALLKDGLYVVGQERHLAIDYTAEDLEEVDTADFDWTQICEKLDRDGFYSVPIAQYEAGVIDLDEMEEKVWGNFRNFLGRAYGRFPDATSVAFH